jgi:hypothetical protein
MRFRGVPGVSATEALSRLSGPELATDLSHTVECGHMSHGVPLQRNLLLIA